MSTKSTIYYQTQNREKPDQYDGYLHLYWDMGGHKPPGFYIDIGSDVVRIEDPLKLADDLKRVLTLHEANVR